MNDPIAILKHDHREAAAMLKQLAASERPTATRCKTTEKLATALSLHMEIEERLVYPLVAERVGREQEQEAETEVFPKLKSKLSREELSELGDAIADAKRKGLVKA